MMEFDFTIFISSNNIPTLSKEFDSIVFIRIIEIKLDYWEEEDQNVCMNTRKKKEVCGERKSKKRRKEREEE